jgi:hypothetical protein
MGLIFIFDVRAIDFAMTISHLAKGTIWAYFRSKDHDVFTLFYIILLRSGLGVPMEIIHRLWRLEST